MDLHSLGGNVLDHLHVLHVDALRQGEELPVLLGDVLLCILVGAVVTQVLKALGRHLRLEDVVYKLVGVLRVGCVGGDELGHDAKADALLREHHLQVGVGHFGQGHHGGVQHRCAHLTGEQVVLGVVVLDQPDIGGQLQQLVPGGLDGGGVLGVVAFAQDLQRHTVDHPVAVDDAHVVLQALVPQVGVAFDLNVHQAGVVDDGLHPGAVGDGVLVLGVEELPLVHRVDAAVILQLGGVQLLDQPLLDGGFNDVVVGDDQVVVPALGSFQLGQHGFVRVKVGVGHLNAGFLGEGVQHLLGEHPLPGVEHQFAVFRLPAGTSGKGGHQQQGGKGRSKNSFHKAVTSFQICVF